MRYKNSSSPDQFSHAEAANGAVRPPQGRSRRRQHQKQKTTTISDHTRAFVNARIFFINHTHALSLSRVERGLFYAFWDWKSEIVFFVRTRGGQGNTHMADNHGFFVASWKKVRTMG